MSQLVDTLLDLHGGSSSSDSEIAQAVEIGIQKATIIQPCQIKS
ncbi:hypothetical protein M3A75_04345 [Aerococcus viridans]|nr:hypothetical protein [Aerococcus viridans]